MKNLVLNFQNLYAKSKVFINFKLQTGCDFDK